MSNDITAITLAASLMNGPLRTLSEICATLPGSRGASHLNPSTLTRWIIRGTLAADGTRVKLAAVRTGARWLTTLQAVREYQETLTAASMPTDDGEIDVRSPAASRRASDRAEAELIASGA